MIITKLHCGLGNQMFQYAAGLALAHKHRTVQKLDVSWFKSHDGMADHNRYGLNCFNILEQFSSREEKLDFLKTATHHVAPVVDYYSAFFQLKDETYLDGYFQSETFFLPVHETVRQHFTFRFPPDTTVSRWADLILSSSPSVFLHVRRGDYVTLYQDKFGVLGLDYYERALQTLKDRHPNLTAFVFSDDINAVEKELRTDLPCHFVKATEHHNFFDKIRLMSLCDHAIISNSTFAWWGAWLIPSREKTIIAPKPWFTGDRLNELKVVPESWIQLGRLALDSTSTPKISQARV
ncbi:MAG: alpha-1,2-fucosyltransferase [Pseudomonadota bacterium]